MGINSRDDGTKQKGPFSAQSNYTRPDLNDEFVFAHAGIMTQQEMADMFCIERNSLMAKFGESYNAGKAAHKVKRRKQLEDVITQLSQTAEYNHTHPEAKTNEFLKAMTLWMKRYDNLDAKDATPEEGVGEIGADPREIKIVRPTKDDM